MHKLILILVTLFLVSCSQVKIPECEKIKENKWADKRDIQDSVNSCYIRFAETSRDDSICKGLSGRHSTSGILAIDQCFWRVAAAKQEIGMCDMISDKKYAKNMCIQAVGISKRDIDLCDTYFSDSKLIGYRIGCYSGVAAEKGDLGTCEEIKKIQEEDKKECHRDAAVRKLNGSGCENAIDSRYGCYTGVAIKKNDSSICMKISDSYYMSQCTESVRRGHQ